MNAFFKANLLALYALALISLIVPMPWDSGPQLQRITLIVLAIHAAETVVAFKYVKNYRGPLWHSVAKTLLFGLLHWWPLVRASKSTNV